MDILELGLMERNQVINDSACSMAGVRKACHGWIYKWKNFEKDFVF